MTIIRVTQDFGGESPCEDGYFKVVSFSPRHTNFKHPDSINKATLARQLKVGTAFMLDCYQHGGVSWSLSGEGQQCFFDTARGAGILYLTVPPKKNRVHGRPDPFDPAAVASYQAKVEAARRECFEARTNAARNCLKTYNMWCNGDVFLFEVDGELLGDVYVDYGDDDSVIEIAKEHFDLTDPVVQWA